MANVWLVRQWLELDRPTMKQVVKRKEMAGALKTKDNQKKWCKKRSNDSDF
ncbi:hypothetical protein DFA_02948 [Cavenderia fasciculata]|uniref:Uncharacterized protein n=1 Tax=Cavenderia fasciculata TaxID=261658 RepID=F4PG70_CACFS|nr:uncharacterized protein DFA_02948 [Cavenderia fasciculata]EGG24704.1 hypothetical protein DFA_02948 [Cavenderia fasciculata]|eukprot:XP_004362555.1 hypothetical protein DFA_02948 [Cavenderia fasciculata]